MNISYLFNSILFWGIFKIYCFEFIFRAPVLCWWIRNLWKTSHYTLFSFHKYLFLLKHFIPIKNLKNSIAIRKCSWTVLHKNLLNFKWIFPAFNFFIKTKISQNNCRCPRYTRVTINENTLSFIIQNIIQILCCMK